MKKKRVLHSQLHPNHSPCWFRCFSAGPDQDKVQQGESLQVVFFAGCVFWNPQDLSTINRLHVRFFESCWFHTILFTSCGCKTSIYEFLYQNGDSWRGISPTVCLLIKIQRLEPEASCRRAYVWATTLYISWSMRKSTLYKQTQFEQTYKTIKPQNHVRLISSFKISI